MSKLNKISKALFKIIKQTSIVRINMVITNSIKISNNNLNILKIKLKNNKEKNHSRWILRHSMYSL